MFGKDITDIKMTYPIQILDYWPESPEQYFKNMKFCKVEKK